MSNITLTQGRDVNGNRVVKVKVDGQRAFSLQTAGVLPRIHSGDLTSQEAWDELVEHVTNYGTYSQNMKLSGGY